MKKSILNLSVIILSVSVIFTACKKDSANTNTDNTAQVTTQSDDQSRVSEETDAVSNDADASLEATTSISGRETGLEGLICDATVVADTVSNPKTLTITYNGKNCNGSRTRTGVVVISVPGDKHWKDAGAIVTVAYQNVKITRVIDNKSITLNGTHTITNVNGGLLINLPNEPNGVIHTITSSDMSVTFDDNTQRTWQVARQRLFNYNNGVVVTETGMHADGTNTGIEEWGTTRFGNAFTNSIVTPIVVRQDCSFRLVSGSFKHVSVLATTTVTLGLDASGNVTSCPGSGYYYFKAVWAGVNGKMVTVILPY
jgi:hypothetical protein